MINLLEWIDLDESSHMVMQKDGQLELGGCGYEYGSK